MCSYSVTKTSARHGLQKARNLVITQTHLVERDAATGATVSARGLQEIFAIVRRSGSDPGPGGGGGDAAAAAAGGMEVRIEYKDGQARTYSCSRRDALVCSLLDASLTSGNRDVCVTEGVSDGHRLLPRGEREHRPEKKQGLMESFLGADTVEIWYLKRLGRVASARVNAAGPSGFGSAAAADDAPIFHEVVAAALEFNANVSPEGVSPATDKKHVQNALQPLVRLLGRLAGVRVDGAGTGTGSAATPRMQSDAERAASTLLQAVYRVVKCVCGFRSFLEVSESLEL